MRTTILNYLENGEGNAEVFVFLHGFMGNVRSFDAIVKPLSQVRRCLAFDLPGHGGSLFGQIGTLKQLATVEETAGLILRDLDALRVHRFSLYGYSMGGRIAQNMAILAPGRIKRLILESASFGIADPEERERRYLRDRALLAGIRTREDYEAFLADWHHLPLFRSLRGTSHVDTLIREKMGNDVEELRRAQALLSVGNHPYFGERLAALGIPMLYLCGVEDEAYAQSGRLMRDRLPGLTLIEFPGASHNVHIQFPEKIAGVLQSLTD